MISHFITCGLDIRYGCLYLCCYLRFLFSNFQVSPREAVLMMLVIVIRSSAAPTEAGDKTARLSYGYPNMQQPLPYGGSNFYGGNNNGIYYNQGAISPFPLILDASCKK